jgi:hypothetical protein
MAQTILMQEKALNEAQARIEELEGLDDGNGRGRPAAGPWDARPGYGGGFLAGAAQTAMGVAGGVLLGNMLADWLMPGEASAQETDLGAEADFSGEQADAGNVDVADAGGDFGDFDFGGF